MYYDSARKKANISQRSTKYDNKKKIIEPQEPTKEDLVFEAQKRALCVEILREIINM